MEFLIVVFVCLISLGVLAFIYNINLKDIKKLKELGYSKELNEITDAFPDNIEVGKEIVKMLGNETDVKIEENKDKNAKASLYIVATNKICIANIKESFTRIQTIAHECIHSTQNKRLLMFNFIYSNIYLLCFIILIALTCFKKIQNPMLYTFIFTFLSFIHYKVKSYIETDAMTKAPFIAEDYMKKTNILEKEKIDIIMKNYETINNIGIKLVNFKLFFDNIIKIIIYGIICFIVYR